MPATTMTTTSHLKFLIRRGRDRTHRATFPGVGIGGISGMRLSRSPCLISRPVGISGSGGRFLRTFLQILEGFTGRKQLSVTGYQLSVISYQKSDVTSHRSVVA